MNKRDENICAMSAPSPGEAGKTGNWRDQKPVIDQTLCLPYLKKKPVCFLCALYCPEGVISDRLPLAIDYPYCKGCGICAAECPIRAIRMVPEDQAP